ncbi:MAG: dihydroneopterin aldolase family protein [Candidatus Methanoplasma sp.]|jgi:hypothetical protein|nr:dihydroneopterin aldolase family protein [Candidatus Methanoplasma sp.]
MASDRESLAAGRFACTERERALFEAGIKMGTIYHQFVGVPVDAGSAEALEEAIAKGVMVQPYVKGVRVGIDRAALGPKTDEYSYVSLTGEMLDVALTIRIGGVEVEAEMRYDRELRYPLMFVSRISEGD